MDSLIVNKPERRTAIMAVAEVSWEDSNSIARTISARIEDTSNSGACLRISVAIQVGTLLNVSWREGQFSGTVKYCREEGRDYIVGIQRTAPSSASTKVRNGTDEHHLPNAEIPTREKGAVKPSAIPRKSKHLKIVPAAQHEDKSTLASRSTLPVNLLSLEEIYRVAGIPHLRSGGAINKVIKILEGHQFRALPEAMKRVSLLTALEVAGLPVQDILQDGELRLSALEGYEAERTKQLHELETRKVQVNAEIQKEMDRITARFQERLLRNLDEIAALRTPLAAWRKLKNEEAQRISEILKLCGNQAAADSPDDSSLRKH